jgi:hypothetical protein
MTMAWRAGCLVSYPRGPIILNLASTIVSSPLTLDANLIFQVTPVMASSSSFFWKRVVHQPHYSSANPNNKNDEITDDDDDDDAEKQPLTFHSKKKLSPKRQGLCRLSQSLWTQLCTPKLKFALALTTLLITYISSFPGPCFDKTRILSIKQI